MGLRLSETIDERPDLMRKRRSELAIIVMKNKDLTALCGGPAKVESMTKDQLLQFLGFQSHLPKTHPLGMEPGDVPYEHWSDDQLRIECKKRRIELGWAAKATRAQLIAKIKEDDATAYGTRPAADPEPEKPAA